MIRKHRSKSHGPRMQDCFVAKTTQTRMAMYDFNLLPDNDVSEGWEERKDGRKRCGAVYNEEGHMVDFQAIREVAHASSTFIGMRYNDNLVAPID